MACPSQSISSNNFSNNADFTNLGINDINFSMDETETNIKCAEEKAKGNVSGSLESDITNLKDSISTSNTNQKENFSGLNEKINNTSEKTEDLNSTANQLSQASKSQTLSSSCGMKNVKQALNSLANNMSNVGTSISNYGLEVGACEANKAAKKSSILSNCNIKGGSNGAGFNDFGFGDFGLNAFYSGNYGISGANYGLGGFDLSDFDLGEFSASSSCVDVGSVVDDSTKKSSESAKDIAEADKDFKNQTNTVAKTIKNDFTSHSNTANNLKQQAEDESAPQEVVDYLAKTEEKSKETADKALKTEEYTANPPEIVPFTPPKVKEPDDSLTTPKIINVNNTERMGYDSNTVTYFKDLIQNEIIDKINYIQSEVDSGNLTLNQSNSNRLQIIENKSEIIKNEITTAYTKRIVKRKINGLLYKTRDLNDDVSSSSTKTELNDLETNIEYVVSEVESKWDYSENFETTA